MAEQDTVWALTKSLWELENVDASWDALQTAIPALEQVAKLLANCKEDPALVDAIAGSSRLQILLTTIFLVKLPHQVAARSASAPVAASLPELLLCAAKGLGCLADLDVILSEDNSSDDSNSDYSTVDSGSEDSSSTTTEGGSSSGDGDGSGDGGDSRCDSISSSQDVCSSDCSSDSGRRSSRSGDGSHKSTPTTESPSGSEKHGGRPYDASRLTDELEQRAFHAFVCILGATEALPAAAAGSEAAQDAVCDLYVRIKTKKVFSKGTSDVTEGQRALLARLGAAMLARHASDLAAQVSTAKGSAALASRLADPQQLQEHCFALRAGLHGVVADESTCLAYSEGQLPADLLLQAIDTLGMALGVLLPRLPWGALESCSLARLARLFRQFQLLHTAVSAIVQPAAGALPADLLNNVSALKSVAERLRRQPGGGNPWLSSCNLTDEQVGGVLQALRSATEALLHLVDRASKAADPEEAAVAQGGILVLPLLQHVTSLCGLLGHYFMAKLGAPLPVKHLPDFMLAQELCARLYAKGHVVKQLYQKLDSCGAEFAAKRLNDMEVGGLLQRYSICCFFAPLMTCVARLTAGELEPQLCPSLPLGSVQGMTASLAKAVRLPPYASAPHDQLRQYMPFVVEAACNLYKCAAGQQASTTSRMREIGFAAFVCVPLMAKDSSLLPGPYESLTIVTSTINLVTALGRSGVMDEAVRAGLGTVLCDRFAQISAVDEEQRDAYMQLARHAVEWPSLGLALAKDGLLDLVAAKAEDIATSFSRRSAPLTRGGRPREDPVEKQRALVAIGHVLRSVCTGLDSAAGTDILRSHLRLLASAPANEAQAEAAMRCHMTLPRAIRPLTTPGYWRAARSQLLPGLVQQCRELAARGSEMDAVYREIAVSAIMCTNPGCANVSGCREADLAHKRCSGCLEARYCCRECQRSDWGRHKPICHQLKEVKGLSA